jgi:hypothetical protein
MRLPLITYLQVPHFMTSSGALNPPNSLRQRTFGPLTRAGARRETLHSTQPMLANIVISENTIMRQADDPR